MPQTKGYSRTQIRLHWVIAGLIVFQLIFGEDMGRAWLAVENGTVPEMGILVWAHIVVGIAVLVLAVWRIYIKVTRGVPAAPPSAPWMETAAKIGHLALYAVMILAPMSGLAAWYGGIAAAAVVHELFKPALILLILGHIGAALYHHFVKKDGLLLRMKTPQD
ncbi:MAG: cytochrome b [Microgenomates group bacterium]